MKRKQRFVTPKVTRAVPLYPESDLLVPGSTMYDQTWVSTGIGSENYSDGDAAGTYIEYDY